MLLKETVLLQEARLEIELDAELHYTLRYGDLVAYTNGVRCIRGKQTRYEFRSVEQLRYDFERDVEAVGGRL
jgi:hypothetical protein